MKKLSALLAIAAVLGAVCPADAQFVNPGSRSRPNPAFGGCTTYTTLPTLLNNQTGPVICDTKGSTFTVIRDAALNARGVNVTAGNALQSDLTSVAGTAALTGNGVTGAGSPRVTISSNNSPFPVSIDQTTPGTTNLVALSAATTNVIGTVRVLGNVGAIFDQATGSAVPANGLYTGINVAGNLRGPTGVNPSGSVFATQVDLASVAGTTALTGGVAGSQGIGGLAANGATAAGNPVLGGCRAQNAELTAVTNGQAVDCVADLVGRQIYMPFANKENFATGIVSGVTGTGNNTLLAAAGAGVKIYMTGFSCTNTGATNSLVTFQSGAAGTAIWITINPAGSGSNGTIVPPVATAANTLLNVVFGSSSTSQSCSFTGYTGT